MDMYYKEKLFNKAIAAGFSDCEIYYRRGRAFESQIFNTEVSDYKNSSFEGLQFRGTYNSKMGYAYTERPVAGTIDFLIDSAAANAGIIDDPGESLCRVSGLYPEVNTYYGPLEEISQVEKIEAAKVMERAALLYDPRIVSVPYCAVGTAEDEVIIANTYGLELYHRRNFALAYVFPQAEYIGKSKLSGEQWHGNHWEDFRPEELAVSAARRTLSYLNAKPVKSGKYRVLLSNETAADIFKVFTGAFFAENVQKGFSLLKGKIGDMIASPMLTIRDDAVRYRGAVHLYPNNRRQVIRPPVSDVPFDAEGVAARNKVVVEKGVLKTYLYNIKSAVKDGMESTGNGYRSGIQGAITTACTNFYLTSSGKTFDDMLAELDNGLYITELTGLHSGTNIVSGDFSISAAGFLVTGGVTEQPVEQITIAGNFYHMLKNIEGVGNDLKFDIPGRLGTVGSPSVLISGLDVSGL